MKKTVYLTSIGITNYQETNYFIEGGTEKIKTKFACYAIKHLIPELKKADTYLIATNDALIKYEKDIQGLLGNLKTIEVPFVNSSENFNILFNKIFDCIPHDTEIDLYIDITSTYRSLQFVLFAILVYLSGLESVTIKGVYYGAYEAHDNENNSPIVQLNSIFETIDWFYSARLFKEFGLSRHLGKKLEAIQDNCHKTKKNCENPPTKLKSFGNKLRKLSFGLYNANVLSVMENSNRLRNFNNQYITELERFIPIAKPLIDKTITEYNLFITNKNGILDQQELEAEAKLINWYIKHEQYKNACTLMREWVVNQVIMESGDESKKNWLDYRKSRKPAENVLTKLNIFYDKEDYKKFLDKFSENGKTAIENVKKLFDIRNALSHGGFSENKNKCISSIDKLGEEIKDLWAKIQTIQPQTYINAYDRNIEIDTLLITPLGLSPGVLYTLLTCNNEFYDIKNTKILILTSKDAEPYISDCFINAGISPSFIIDLLDDPHKQIKSQEVIEKKYLEKILGSRQIVINYTGGTSIMQVNAQIFAKIANKFSVSFKEVVVIDERSIDEQRKKPYVTGLMRELI